MQALTNAYENFRNCSNKFLYCSKIYIFHIILCIVYFSNGTLCKDRVQAYTLYIYVHDIVVYLNKHDKDALVPSLHFLEMSHSHKHKYEHTSIGTFSHIYRPYPHLFVGQPSPSFSSTVCFQSCPLSFHVFPSLPGCSQSIYVYGCPLLLFPGTTMSISFRERLSSSLLLMCLYKFNLFCLGNVDIWHTLASSCITWFLTWSFLVLLLSRLAIATCNILSSFFLTAQQSAPYVIVGLIIVNEYLLSHSTPVSCFHFIQASFTRLLMSLYAPPFESKIYPKYLNVVAVFSSPSCISS